MEVKVKKFKGEKDLQKGIEKMLKDGWRLENQNSRKALYSLTTGVFTRKQIHTVTFIKD